MQTSKLGVRQVVSGLVKFIPLEHACMHIYPAGMHAYGVRQVVSGLVKFIPLEQMKGRRVVVLANLKASKMRGVESQAMVLCGASADGSTMELVEPPAGVPLGERVSFPGHEGEPEKQLNPKKKVWNRELWNRELWDRELWNRREAAQPEEEGVELTVPLFLHFPCPRCTVACHLPSMAGVGEAGARDEYLQVGYTYYHIWQVWEKLAPEMNTSADRVARWREAPFTTSGGVCTVASVAGGIVK